MVTMSVKEALAIALKAMQSLTADELRVELAKNSNGPFATALREAQEFFYGNQSSAYPIFHAEAHLADETAIEYVQHSQDFFWKLQNWAANDNSYALAA